MPGDFANRDEALQFLRRFVDQGAGPSANLTNTVLQAMAVLLIEHFEQSRNPVVPPPGTIPALPQAIFHLEKDR